MLRESESVRFCCDESLSSLSRKETRRNDFFYSCCQSRFQPFPAGVRRKLGNGGRYGLKRAKEGELLNTVPERHRLNVSCAVYDRWEIRAILHNMRNNRTLLPAAPPFTRHLPQTIPATILCYCFTRAFPRASITLY